MSRIEGISYTYEQIPPIIKEMVDPFIADHIKKHPEEEFAILFTYYDDDKNTWMAEPYFQNKSVSELNKNQLI
jgi:hypothetical protein